MHKKRFLALILVLAVGGGSLLTGCGSVDKKEAEEARNAGIVAMGKGSYGQAADDFDQALATDADPKTATGRDNYFYKALALFNSNDYQGAIDTYSTVLEKNPKDADAYYRRAAVYLSDGNLDAA